MTNKFYDAKNAAKQADKLGLNTLAQLIEEKSQIRWKMLKLRGTNKPDLNGKTAKQEEADSSRRDFKSESKH